MFNFNVKDTLVLALLYLLCGLALCFFQGSILTTVVRIIGIVLIAYGAYMLYVYFGVHKSADTAPMFSGVPSLVLGLIMVCWPHTIINFIPIIVGVLLVINSIVQIQSSLVLKAMALRAGYSPGCCPLPSGSWHFPRHQTRIHHRYDYDDCRRCADRSGSCSLL
ncbi:DUF308 domain-containing protein [Allobaculum sp. Allo2]|nr:DUF308 domain-containing protein [Allobaculum sp. Allo2]UNT93889.1 DUF308 domain-containing protein [Allobaculum sp. Allo2]